MIYATWGDTARALLKTAKRDQSIDLVYMTMSAGFHSVPKEPRFQAIEKALKFPDWCVTNAETSPRSCAEDGG